MQEHVAFLTATDVLVQADDMMMVVVKEEGEMVVGEAELHLEELVVMREEVEVEHDMLIFVEHVPTPVDV